MSMSSNWKSNILWDAHFAYKDIWAACQKDTTNGKVTNFNGRADWQPLAIGKHIADSSNHRCWDKYFGKFSLQLQLFSVWLIRSTRAAWLLAASGKVNMNMSPAQWLIGIRLEGSLCPKVFCATLGLIWANRHTCESIVRMLWVNRFHIVGTTSTLVHHLLG